MKAPTKETLTTLWQTASTKSDTPVRASGFFIQSGAVWLALRDIMAEQKDLARYRGNIAFSLSSNIGWDIKEGKMPFYYPDSQKEAHPMNFYVPLEYAMEKLDKSGGFALGVERYLRHRQKECAGSSINMLSRLFKKTADNKYRNKRTQIGDLMLEALCRNNDRIKHKIELDRTNWTYYNPAKGGSTPFFLSTNEDGAGFDFTMRRQQQARNET